MKYDNIAGARRVITVLQLMGLWHFPAPWQSIYAIYSGLLHFAFTFPYTIMMWVDVVQASDLEKFSYVMYMSLTELALLAKVTNVWRHSQLLVDFFETVSQHEIFTLRSASVQNQWTRVHQYYRYLAFMYFFMSTTLVTSAFVGVLFAPEYELPFPYAPPFDWQSSPNYWYAYFYELVAMPVTCFSNCALDMIQCYMLLHLSLCYKLIGTQLSQLGKEGKSWNKEAKFYENLITIIVLHRKTKELLKQCEVFVSFPFLIQILCSSFVLCFSAYRLQNVGVFENPSQFFTLMLAVIVMILQIFVPCYCGNEITLASQALNNDIYHAEWLQCTPKMRKYLIIYMELLQQPTIVRAGNFFQIGLPIFTKTMNNTYSLMALLLNMNK